MVREEDSWDMLLQFDCWIRRDFEGGEREETDSNCNSENKKIVGKALILTTFRPQPIAILQQLLILLKLKGKYWNEREM